MLNATQPSARTPGVTAAHQLQSTKTPGRAGRREWLALAALMLPVLLVAVDNTVLSFAMPSISLEFNTSGTTLLWIIDSYPLVLAGLLVAMGSFGDRFGRRRLLMIGAAGFAIFSVIAAFAPTAEFLVASRVGLGVFGAMLMPSTLSLIRNIFADRNQRRLAIAVWAAGFSAGAALGPIVGGVLLEHFWWGSVFLLAVPVLVLLLAVTPFLVPESKDPNPGKVDYPSIALSIVTMLPIVFAIKNLAKGGIPAVTVAAVVVGLIAGTAFVRRQLRRPNPMLDVRLFTVRPFTGAVLVNLLAIFALVGFIYFVSQHLQLVLGHSPLEAGLILLPGLVMTIVAGLAVVPVVKRFPPYVVVPTALMLSAVAYAFVALTGQGGNASALLFAFVLLGMGVGASETVSNDLILSTVPATKAGAASAVSETAYEVGSVFGTALLGSVLLASPAESVTPRRVIAGTDDHGHGDARRRRERGLVAANARGRPAAGLGLPRIRQRSERHFRHRRGPHGVRCRSGFLESAQGLISLHDGGGHLPRVARRFSCPRAECAGATWTLVGKIPRPIVWIARFDVQIGHRGKNRS